MFVSVSTIGLALFHSAHPRTRADIGELVRTGRSIETVQGQRSRDYAMAVLGGSLSCFLCAFCFCFFASCSAGSFLVVLAALSPLFL